MFYKHWIIIINDLLLGERHNLHQHATAASSSVPRPLPSVSPSLASGSGSPPSADWPRCPAGRSSQVFSVCTWWPLCDFSLFFSLDGISPLPHNLMRINYQLLLVISHSLPQGQPHRSNYLCSGGPPHVPVSPPVPSIACSPGLVRCNSYPGTAEICTNVDSFCNSKNISLQYYDGVYWSQSMSHILIHISKLNLLFLTVLSSGEVSGGLLVHPVHHWLSQGLPRQSRRGRK